MAKERKTKEVIKVEYKEKEINNSDIYNTAINRAAIGFAEHIAREQNLSRIHCPGVDFGVRMLAKKLVEDNIIDAVKLFNYLKKESYRSYDDIIVEWWK
jgi:hypothetical protein